MKWLSCLLALSLTSFFALQASAQCTVNTCDPIREAPCFLDQDLGNITRCICQAPFTIRIEGVCVQPGEIGKGCDKDSECTKANEVCDLRISNPPSQGGVGGITKLGVCRCAQGFARNRNNGSCLPVFDGPPNRAAVCTAWGEPHYDTFDSYASYAYQGKCDYAFVRHQNLEVQVRQGNCGPPPPAPVSCILGVAFLAGMDAVVFNASGCFINGQPVTTFPVSVNGVNITNTTGPNCAYSPPPTPAFIALLPDGSRIEYAKFCASVSLPASYYVNDTGLPTAWLGTKGLCGSWNDKPQDDGRAWPNAELVGDIYDMSNDTAAIIHGDSWQIPPNQNLFGTPNPDCGTKKRAVGSAICDGNQTRVAEIVDICRALSNPCPDSSDFQSFFFACVYDGCYLPNLATDFFQNAQSALNGYCTFLSTGVFQRAGTNPLNPFDTTNLPTTLPSTTIPNVFNATTPPSSSNKSVFTLSLLAIASLLSILL